MCHIDMPVWKKHVVDVEKKEAKSWVAIVSKTGEKKIKFFVSASNATKQQESFLWSDYLIKSLLSAKSVVVDQLSLLSI